MLKKNETNFLSNFLTPCSITTCKTKNFKFKFVNFNPLEYLIFQKPCPKVKNF